MTSTDRCRSGAEVVDRRQRRGTRGNYSFDTATSMISFSSGSLLGYNSKLLGPGKFGLSEDSTTMFYTVCNLK